MYIEVPIALIDKDLEKKNLSDIEWSLPEGFDCYWVKAPPKIVLRLREEHEDGSYSDWLFSEKE